VYTYGLFNSVYSSGINAQNAVELRPADTGSANLTRQGLVLISEEALEGVQAFQATKVLNDENDFATIPLQADLADHRGGSGHRIGDRLACRCPQS
jgi:hypothetical protein